MDLLLLSKGLDFAKKRKKWVVLLALFGASSYGAYKVYNLPSLTRKRRRMLNLFRVLFSVAETVSDLSETIGLLSNDLKEFLRSDSDEIPNSLKQISKIARSGEFSDSLTRVSEALSVGILRGYGRESSDQGELEATMSFADRVIERILSNAGIGFASVVAGSFARNLVLGFYASRASGGSSDGNRMASGLSDSGEFSSMSKWVDLIFDNKCKELMINCIQVFVSTAVAVYLEKTLHINTYDEVFAGLTNPNHESKVQELIVSVCNGAVETFVKTSHHVLTSKTANSEPASSSSETDHGECSNMEGQFGGGTEVATHVTGNHLFDKAQSSGWGGMVLSTLSVPRNQRFVFHVTGRVTFETFRSFVEFLLWKLSEGLRTGGNVVHDHVVDKGRRVVRYFGLKSFVFVTICLALYLHIACGTRALLPAKIAERFCHDYST